MFSWHSATRALLTSWILCAAAASTGLNVNHALYTTRQALPSDADTADPETPTRQLGSATLSPILTALHVIEVLKADFGFVTKEFLCIAMGGHGANSFASDAASVEAGLSAVKLGDPSRNIIAPPSNGTATAVDALVSETATFHALLSNNLGSSISMSTLEAVDAAYNRLVSAYEEALRQYEAYGAIQGVTESKIENYAYRLQSYTERIVVQAFFYALNVRQSFYYTEMIQYQKRFASLMESITWGDVVAGIPDLTNVCALQSMLKVSEAWFQLEAELQEVTTTGGSELAKTLTTSSNQLRTHVKSMNVQIAQPACEPARDMDQAAWKNGLSECNLFRRLVAKASRVYLEVLTKADSSIEQLMLTQAITDAAATIGNSYKGSHLQKVPVAPSQELVDNLKIAYDSWVLFRSDLVRSVRTHGTGVAQDLSSLEKIANQSADLNVMMAKVGQLYVVAARAADSSSRAAVWQSAKQNLGLLQTMAKEALLINSADSAMGRTGPFLEFTAAFERTHWELLRGTSSSYAVPEVPLNRTTDACTLTTMATMLVDYQALKTILIQMYGSKDFLTSHKGFIAAEAASPVLVDAFVAFKRGWDEFRPTDELRLQDLQIAYIYANPNALGSKDNLDFAQGSEFYHQAHKQFHPTYRAILYERNYYDIFIFDLQGNLIYSVYKELDYATNFLADGPGQWKDSGLGEAFRAAVVNPDIINIIDWKPYGPSYGALASFLSTGIKKDGELVGVFCTQMPPESKPVEISEMQPVLAKAEETMTTAVDFYMKGYGTCTTVLDQTSWEIMMENFNSVDYLLYQAQMEFALLAHGYSQTWLNNSAMGLEEHKGFLVIEAGKPALADALWSFKQAWDAYRATDAERLLSLQIAYILLNPFPTGEKDKLDRASGPEQYHVVHKQYHPTYRDILYARNYYDIFFFDLGGNLIYSELDYATNFLADGPGEWKDSGLGKAFRAAVANPDGINVIDWEPYGPSYGALASFLSTGVRRAGELIGVFCTQLPPEFTPRNSSARLETGTQAMSKIFEDYKFGGLPAHPPPSEEISWKLFNLSDIWTGLGADFSGPTTVDVLNRVVAKSADFASYAEALSTGTADLAYAQEPTLPGYKMSVAAANLALLQKIQRNLVLIYTGGYDGFRSSLLTDITLFEENQALLRDGNMHRRLAQSNIERTESYEGLKMLDTADSAWAAMKPIVQNIAVGAAITDTLKSIVELSDDTVEAVQSVQAYFSSTTRTTTMLALELLAPMPMTGSWAAGTTFRLAARLAEGIINQDQLLLPGYRLQHVIFDDKCDESVGSDIVVSAMAEKDTYVGIGGMGCDRVCRPISSLATSLRLPFLSYECPSPDFSDTLGYPALARMGTVTKTGMLTTIEALKGQNGWTKIFVVSGDPAFYQEQYMQDFQAMGFGVESLSAYENRWNDVKGIMASIKGRTKGLERVVFVLGSETFYRKLVCASITEGLQKGIVWISEGTWRSQWWKKTDLLTSAHRQWLREDVGGLQLKQAFADFKAAWDSFRPTVQATRQDLFDLYVTDQKDELAYAEGDERYHGVHAKYHPIYRQKLYDRAYYDIFFFDLEGDLIYSVFKETDYATNFAGGASAGEWSDSGLGEAFRGALANPDNLTYIDWSPYGPSAYADAAFFSTGLRDEDGLLIGVYAIQLPPEYERSIEDTVEECSFETITEAFQGAINVAGLGRPVEENMEKPLPCFKGYSPRSLLSLLDLRFQTGYPVGDPTLQVEDPYFDVKAHAVDGTCAFAFGLQFLMRQGHTVEQIQRRDPDVYEKFTNFFRTDLYFQGASGLVKFEGNDKKNLLVVQQNQNGQNVEVGLISQNGTLEWIGNGTEKIFWQVEPAETFELMWVLHPIALTLAICCPCLFGCYIGYRIRKASLNAQSQSQSAQ
eukprot:s102_g32.t1